jgi:hypothetical protein
MEGEMDEQSPQEPEDLQFGKAEPTEDSPSELSCTYCQGSIHDNYFEVNGLPSCEKCRYEVEQERQSGTGAGRVMRALIAGGIAAVIGASIYYGVSALTGYEFGLIAIVVGLMVGFAVKWGSRGRGGWVYQTIAMALTYIAIVSTYVPHIIEAIQSEEMGTEISEQATEETAEGSEAEESVGTDVATSEDAAAPAADESMPVEDMGLAGLAIGLVILFLFIMAVPFLAGFENIIGLIIIGIGLYEAWKINKYQPFVVEGPFKVGAGTL